MSRQRKQQQQATISGAQSDSLATIRRPAHKMNHRSYIDHAAPTYEILNRTWATQDDAAGMGGPTHRFDVKETPPTQRWMEERLREQPWNNVGTFVAGSSYKETQAAGGETGSNSAVAGSDERKSYMSDK